jgi:hypothetical protein
MKVSSKTIGRASKYRSISGYASSLENRPIKNGTLPFFLYKNLESAISQYSKWYRLLEIIYYQTFLCFWCYWIIYNITDELCHKMAHRTIIQRWWGEDHCECEIFWVSPFQALTYVQITSSIEKTSLITKEELLRWWAGATGFNLQEQSCSWGTPRWFILSTQNRCTYVFYRKRPARRVDDLYSDFKVDTTKFI